MTDLNRDVIATAIIEAVHRRGPDKTLCPSEVARALAPDTWRDLMGDIRAVATELASNGLITIRQGGVVQDPSLELKGPIRLGGPTAMPDA
ncbi:MAG: DUF3253 domain-containing protein [Alphaproteobacteria bacterium]|nr:DUF3253 domain-containing protein [Alphaproteobacteria bacterium SS10]